MINQFPLKIIQNIKYFGFLRFFLYVPNINTRLSCSAVIFTYFCLFQMVIKSEPDHFGCSMTTHFKRITSTRICINMQAQQKQCKSNCFCLHFYVNSNAFALFCELAFVKNLLSL